MRNALQKNGLSNKKGHAIVNPNGGGTVQVMTLNMSCSQLGAWYWLVW